MGSLVGKSPANTYKSLLKVADETNGVSTSNSQIEDGEGTATCLSVSDDALVVQPQNDNTVATFAVRGTGGDYVCKADTSNSVLKVGSTSTAANTQIIEFNVHDLTPTAGTHYFVSKGVAKYNMLNGVTELSNGTGTDPATTYDGGTETDELITHLFIAPINLTVDACKFMVSTSTDTDTVINVHLYKFTMSNNGDTNDGNLSGGTLLANGQATAVDRNVIKTVTCTVDSSAVSAGEVIACFVENETNTNSIRLNTQVLYHFD